MSTLISKKYKEWLNLFQKDDLLEFTTNSEGVLWLKIKSIARKEIMNNFLIENKILLQNTKINLQFEELFELLKINIKNSHTLLDKFIRKVDLNQRDSIDELSLVDELYKLKFFSWGGNYSNALDKYLVDSYVKVYKNFDILMSKFEIEISRAVQGYVLCSWYNHWSSILIENIFKSHQIILPTVGQIKKVDFFINGIPFDLKVTYLPENFVELKRRLAGLKSELSLLKQTAKELNICFNKDNRAEDIFYELTEKIKDKNDIFGLQILKSIKDFRKDLVEQILDDPKELIVNLYEQQGEMRFDASNRLFLILVDTNDYDNSWKLKRNLNVLKPSILEYLDNFDKSLNDLQINFNYKDKGSFTAFADAIVIKK